MISKVLEGSPQNLGHSALAEFIMLTLKFHTKVTDFEVRSSVLVPALPLNEGADDI